MRIRECRDSAPHTVQLLTSITQVHKRYIPWVNAIYNYRHAYHRELARVQRLHRNTWVTMSRKRRVAAVCRDPECFEAALELALCQHNLNISFLLVEFHAWRSGASLTMRSSKPSSSMDIAHLAHDAQLLQLGRHPYQVDSARTPAVLASGALPSGGDLLGQRHS